jgi:hypothetical protein
MLLCCPLTGGTDQTFPEGYIKPGTQSSYEQNVTAPVLSRARVDYFFDNYKAPASPADRYFNVMQLSDAEVSRIGFKKAYSMICGLDPFRDEGMVWAERLKKGGFVSLSYADF